ncbi:hypothetical protein EZS27_018924 [termite gut metagenome]|uniref:Uncharacterized protein n=1 Tax=termite gut metagenome TaxID=433724 RepID=A0A5J4RG24_9ZZZZ
MEKIFVLGNNKVIRQIGFPFVEIPYLTSDYEIHNWIVALFQNNDIEKLMIEIGEKPELSLKLGLHIRLTFDELKEKILIPIIYASTNTLNTIIIETGIWSHLFASKGVSFSSLENMEDIKTEIAVMEDIAPNDYKTGFLNVIKILPDETIGRHSLANIWGAYRMDKAANTNALNDNSQFEQNRKRLYFKYISAFNFQLKPSPFKVIGQIAIGEPKVIDARNKKILLVDDEADKGWELLLRKVFQTTKPEDFAVISEKVKNFDSLSPANRKIIETQQFDLYLIDLRLNGLIEEDNLKTSEFSGMKMLQKIKNINPGNQVIIFTASNKVWNLKALLDAGADGYYLKESPEYNFSNELSEQNYQQFRDDIKICFERDYIRGLYSDIQSIKMKLSSLSYPKDFLAQLTNQLGLFFDMIVNAKNETQFAYAYVTLYMVIEIINNQFIKKVTDDKWEIDGSVLLLDWQWNKEAKQYANTGQEIVGNKPPEWQKLSGLYFQKWKGSDNNFISNIYHLIDKRNGFVHKDNRILEKKDSQGNYVNKDVYIKEGVVNLFGAVKIITSFL